MKQRVLRTCLVVTLSQSIALGTVVARVLAADDAGCTPGARDAFRALGTQALPRGLSTEEKLNRPLTRFVSAQPDKLEFRIPPEQIKVARAQADQEVLANTLFVVPNNDGEAERVVDVLRAVGAPHLKISAQGWGATLEREALPPIAELKKRGITRIAVMEIPDPATEKALRDAGLEVVAIDHHAYASVDRRQPRSSLEQVMALIHWPMSRTDEALAVNDRSYVPGLKALGLKPDEISRVRRFDLVAQGRSESFIDSAVSEANHYIDRLKPVGGIYVLHSPPDEGIVKQELAIRAADGLVSAISPSSNRLGFSGSPAIAQKLLDFDFEALGYPKGSYDRYGGGDPAASMFFGFKPKMPPKGSREMIPPEVMQAVGRAIEQADPKAVGIATALAQPASNGFSREAVPTRDLASAKPSIWGWIRGKKPMANEDRPAIQSPALPTATAPATAAAQSATSALGTVLEPEVREAGMLPRGAALLTGAGDLERQGIRHIIHAASGAMTQGGKHFAPSLEGVTDSVRNSLVLAAEAGHQRVALPFVGGKIFVDRIGIAAQELANQIVDAALAARGNLELRFVTFGEEDTSLFRNALARFKGRVPAGAAEVTPGSITDFKTHGASAIVNAANMEVQFGGGLSGAIARATGQPEKINAEAQAKIQDFYRTTR